MTKDKTGVAQAPFMTIEPDFQRPKFGLAKPVKRSESGDCRLSSIEVRGEVKTRLCSRDFGSHMIEALRTGQTGGVIFATLIRLDDKRLVDFYMEPSLLRTIDDALADHQ